MRRDRHGQRVKARERAGAEVGVRGRAQESESQRERLISHFSPASRDILKSGDTDRLTECEIVFYNANEHHDKKVKENPQSQ